MLLVSLALLPLVGTAPVFAQERYYLVLFGASNGRPTGSHCWGTFVKVSHTVAEDEDEEAAPEADTFTISWMPANPASAPKLLSPAEPGRNLTLDETMEWCRREGVTATAWGPIEIRKDLYDLAVQRKKFLDSGRIAYKMLDRRGRGVLFTNCINALADVVRNPMLSTGPAFGAEATAMIADHFRRFMVEPSTNHSDVLSYLNLNGHTVRYRNLP
jgi:hypothetical protein